MPLIQKKINSYVINTDSRIGSLKNSLLQSLSGKKEKNVKELAKEQQGTNHLNNPFAYEVLSKQNTIKDRQSSIEFITSQR